MLKIRLTHIGRPDGTLTGTDTGTLIPECLWPKILLCK